MTTLRARHRHPGVEVAQPAAVRAGRRLGVADLHVRELEVGQHVARLGGARRRSLEHALEQPDALVVPARLEEVRRAVARLARLALRVVVARGRDPRAVRVLDVRAATLARPLEALQGDGVRAVARERVPARHVVERALDLRGGDVGELHEVPDHPLERPEQRVRVLGVEVLGVLVPPAQHLGERQVRLGHLAAPHVRLDEDEQRVGARGVGALGLDALELGRGGRGAREAVGHAADVVQGGVHLVHGPGHRFSSSAGGSGSVAGSCPAARARASRSDRESFMRVASTGWSALPDASTAVT